MSNYTFPKGFLWGVAGSAFQMEGAMREGGRGYGYPMDLVGVSFDTLERVPRDSFYYYQKVIANNMVD